MLCMFSYSTSCWIATLHVASGFFVVEGPCNQFCSTFLLLHFIPIQYFNAVKVLCFIAFHPGLYHLISIELDYVGV